MRHTTRRQLPLVWLNRLTLLLGLIIGLTGCDDDSASKTFAPPPPLDVIEAMPSEYVAPRKVTVWLPPGYHESDQRYPVLYMHDGQNIFDAATSYIGEEWGIDEAVTRLSEKGVIPPAIVVGVWNTEKRWQEYMPMAIFQRLPQPMREAAARSYGGAPLSDQYLKFLVKELKPYIDQTYRTRPEAEHTSIMGSSMGALISFYALTEYPQVFGQSASLSMHWPLIQPPEEESEIQQHIATVAAAYADYFNQHLPPAGTNRAYFDHGGKLLDAYYPPYQARMDKVLQANDWQAERDWVSHYFPNAVHNEVAWRERIDIPLKFLLADSSDTGNTMGAAKQSDHSNSSRPIEDEVVYFVMPDRFADGDPTNNTAGIPGTADDHGFDPTHKGYFHGGDFKGLIDKLDYIQGLGATAIWVTPIFKNKPVQGVEPHRSAGYHGYWITDFTQVDPHLGTNEDYAALVDAAHARGMKVIMDIVTNHTADVIQYRDCSGTSSEQPTAGEVDYQYRAIADYPYTHRCGPQGPAINEGFLGDAPEHQTLENFARLVDPAYAYQPFVPAAEANIKVPAWLNDPIYYHNRGNSQWEGESNLYGDFAGLDDVFTEHPRVVEGMIEIYKSWITRFKVDGFRIDTAKHVNDSFWQKFVPAIKEHARAQGIDDFYLFGEVYGFEPEFLSRYTRDTRFPAVLDFALQRAIQEVIVEGRPPSRLQEILDQDDLYQGDPRGAAILPTFLGNHDMGRLGHFLLKHYGEDADGDMLLQRAKSAYVVLMFSRGVPVIYYGDEQGFTGHGNDQDARQDMFPSQVASYNDNRLLGTTASTAQDNFDSQHPLYQHIVMLAQLRHNHPALRRGRQIIRVAENRSGIFAFTRELPSDTDSDHSRFLVVVNNADNERRARIPADTQAGESWQLVAGSGPQQPEVRHGSVYFSMTPLSYAVYQSTSNAATR